MPATDAQKAFISKAVQTFRKEKNRIVTERTTNIKKIIAEIDQQKTDTIKKRIAQMP